MKKHRPRRFRQVRVKVTTEWMSADEAAQYLRIASTRALYDMLHRTEIPAFRVGRRMLLFSKTDLDAYIRSRQVTPRPRGQKKKPS
jgi:excisionase family DNA binding protein